MRLDTSRLLPARMPRTKRPTRKQMLGYGIPVVVVLYVTFATIFGDELRPWVDSLNEDWDDFYAASSDERTSIANWFTSFGWQQAVALFVLWNVVREGIIPALIRRRKNHTPVARTPEQTLRRRRIIALSIAPFALVALVGVGVAGALPLGEKVKPEIVATWNSTVGEIDWTSNDGKPTTATGDPQTDAPTGTETGTETDDPADTRTDAPTDTETDVPADNRRDNPTDTGTDTTVDTRTDATPDKPVTNALSGALTDADRIVTDPVKFADQEPLRAALWALAVLMVLMVLVWRVLVSRRNALIRRQMVRDLRKLDRYATEDAKLIAALQERVDALETPNGGNSGGTRVFPKV